MSSSSRDDCPAVLVGGPIQYAIGADGNFDQGLESAVRAITATLESNGLRVLSAHLVEGFGNEDLAGKSQEVATRDYGWVLTCDVFVAVLPAAEGGRPYRSDGTCVEIGWAAAHKKPVVLVLDSEAEYSHLVQGLSAITHVRRVDYDETVRDPSLLVTAVHEMAGGQTKQHVPCVSV
jgi:nucleoside 2-deoxyribosyltransferase